MGGCFSSPAPAQRRSFEAVVSRGDAKVRVGVVLCVVAFARPFSASPARSLSL